MSSSTPKHDNAFVPKQHVSFTIGKETIYLYPDLTSSMSSAEKSYGFMVSKSALESVDSPIRTKLQVLAGCTSTTPLVGILQARFIKHASLYIKRHGIFQVLSYHGRNGRIIANATLDNGNLRPVEGQANATRRPAGLVYAKIEADLQFSDIDPRNTLVHPFSFFVRLNNQAVDVLNSTGNLVSLNTFHGADDWATSYDQTTLDAQIWNGPRSLINPFVLQPPKIEDANADALIETNVFTLEKLALEAAWTTICSKIFEQICPNISQDPASVIQNIHQASQNDGVMVNLTIEQFFNAIQRMTGFFPQNDDMPWPIDVTQHFITHCHQDVRDEMNSNKFVYDSATASKKPYDQLANLQLAYAAAITAESNNSRIRTMARDEVSNQSFLVKAHGSFVAASVAEDTMKKYSPAATNPNPCWGCNELGHAYANREGNITCPNKEKPGVQARATLARKEYNDKLKKRRKDSSKKRSSGVMNGDILRHLNADQITRLSGDQIKALLSINVAGTEKKTKEDSKTVSFWIEVVCLAVTQKPMLPISIDVNLPHVALAIGQSLTGSQFTLSSAYDTCASLCVGYLDFHLAIAKKLPYLVKSLVYAKDEYSPLTLSGIVSDEDSKKTIKPTSTLPVIIEYHMPYKSREGYQTSFKIALGQGVSVNTIIGLSMIRPAKLSLDLTDNVMEPGVLDTVPFPIIFKPTIRSMPDFDNLDEAELKSLYSSPPSVTLADIDACLFYINESTKQSLDESTVKLASNYHAVPDYPKTLISTANESNKDPISVPKNKWRAKTPSLWEEYLKDDSTDFEYIFHNRSGHSLRKRSAHAFPEPNPDFACRFDEAKNGQELAANLVLDPSLSTDTRNRIISFVKEFWDVFNEAGVKIPIQGYEMIIETGNHKPIAVRKPHYGMHEAPIMQKTINKLLDLGFIAKDSTSPWGFRITLAPKPHQEAVVDIDEYIWRFCTNYIRLNMVTRPAEYPIPRCDDAYQFGFGKATHFILLDAFSGYHQVRLSPASQIKTAFFAPYGRKYIWLVMPFGLRNAPVVFTAMMYDLKELWDTECEKAGVDPSHNEGTTIIIDDTFLYGVSEDRTFILLRCVCKIARKYHLTWKLAKAQWFPQSIEFVGVDLHREGGNSPAKSKDVTLKAWKQPQTPRDILAFIGFAIFYLKWLPWFEIKAQPLRQIIASYHLDHPLTSSEFDKEAIAVFEYIRDFLLSAPILQRADFWKRFYLKTDFASKGLGFALCQPSNDTASIEAMKREDAGGVCEFELTRSTKLRLLPCSFGSRKCVGNEIHFHSHPGESLAASWAVTKNRHFLWGRPFTLMTDCRALVWLLDYKGHNHAVKRLQLELLGYWFTIANRPGQMLEDANYFSRLGEDVLIDPLLKDYLSFARQMFTTNPPSPDPLSDENMPGRRAKIPRSELEIELGASELNLAQVEFINEPIDLTPPTNKYQRSISNYPVTISQSNQIQVKSKKNFSYITETAVNLSRFRWCLSEPGHGHFIEESRTASINFEATIVCETNPSARNTMHSRYSSPFVFDALEKLSEFCAKGDIPTIQGYYAQLSEPPTPYAGDKVMKQHENIVSCLRKRARLQIAIFVFNWNLPTNRYSTLMQRLRDAGWIISERRLDSSKDFSDRVSINNDMIIAVNPEFCSPPATLNLQLLAPTPPIPNDMNPKLNPEFNTQKFALPYIGELFSVETLTSRQPRHPSIEYLIKQKEEPFEPGFETGFQVYHKDYPAPLPTPCTIGLFGELFGVSFHNPGYTTENNEPQNCIRSISLFEYTSLFGYSNDYSTYLATQPDVILILARTTPSRTMSQIVNIIHTLLRSNLDSRCETVSASTDLDLSIPALFNGIIRDNMPDDSAWQAAYRNDENCARLVSMIADPSSISNDTLSHVHSSYRAPIRQSQIKWENNRLMLHEPVVNSMNTVKLTIVPVELRRHIFTAFHTNPIGGHFSLYYTLHRIRLRFHWPNMYTYIKNLIDGCVACLLRNGGAKASSELLYSFPISAPFMCVHADAWVPGKTLSFDGYSGLMIVVCHTVGFAAIQPLKDMNSTSFAKAVYTILLRYGLSQMVITDPDSKFKGEFKTTFEMLGIQHHLSARGNHNAILVERFNKFLNAGLRVFDNDRGTNRVFLEGAETLTYAWNSCPVLGTDLSRSLLTVGREFHFPIDFTTNKNISLDPTEKSTKSYAFEMTELLQKSRTIYMMLIAEHRAAHREYRNAQINNPREFKLDDIVFTNVQVQSKQSSGMVRKLAYVKRGPYRIVKDYKSGAYELLPTHGRSKVTIKKHGSDLYLSPEHLTPHRPIKSSDLVFSELNKKTIDQPYNIIGVEGYEPAQPWGAPAATAGVDLAGIQNIPLFPTVQDLDNEFDGWPESGNPFIKRETPITQLPVSTQPIALSAGPTVAHPTVSMLVADIIRSDDKLFFISYSQERSQRRKEWKLVRVDFKGSLQKNPACLQNGRFLVEFFIEHHRDSALDIRERRFWLEYHKSNSHKTLSTSYHIIQPSQFSEKVACDRNLVSYREWIQLSDPAIYLHGPFDFTVIHNRKTRDRIGNNDWKRLIASSSKFDDAPPKFFQQQILHVDITQPIYETILNDKKVEERCHVFMLNLEFSQQTLKEFETAVF